MTSRKDTKKFEKLVVCALRKLQDIQGSTPKEISDYLSHEYDAPRSQIKKQVHLALRRGVSYGILQRNNGNAYVCNKAFLDQQYRSNKKDEVVEPCPWLKFKYWQESQRKKQRKRKRKRKSHGKKSRSRRKRKKHRRKRSKSRRRKRRKRSRSRSLRRKFNSKSDDCSNVVGFTLKKISKNRKGRESLIKKRGNRHRKRSRSRKKRGRGC